MRNPLRFVFLLGLLACGKNHEDLHDKPFDSLDIAERDILSSDSVNGNYLKWVGTNADSVTWALCLDKPNRFAIKSLFEDTTGFFTKVPGNISWSGRWNETGEKVILRFYFPPAHWSVVFDPSKNAQVIKIIDRETIEISKKADVLWMVNTECKRM